MRRESSGRQKRRLYGDPIARAGTFVLAVAAVTGCSSNDNGGQPGGGLDGSAPTSDGSMAGNDGGSTSDTGTTPPADGSAACSDNGGNLGTVKAIAVGSDTTFSAPLDSVPDATGSVIYFTALAPDGTGGVFSVATSGSGAPTMLASGLGLPSSIVLGSDGATLFVADAASPLSTADGGGIVTVGTSGGGGPTLLAGTEGYAPRGLTVQGSSLFFTGVDPANGSAGVFTVAAGGGTASVVAEGDPFREPSGVAVSSSGAVYVLDGSSSASGRGSLLAVNGGAAAVLVDAVSVNFPSGLALSADGSALLASALVAPGSTGQVLLVPLGGDAGAPTSITAGPVATSTEPAGLHRAPNGCLYAWADSAAGGFGTVYALEK